MAQTIESPTAPIDRNQLRKITEISDLLSVPVKRDTVWRWASKGIRGVVLATTKVGDTHFASLRCVDDFQAALNRTKRSRANTARRIANETPSTRIASDMIEDCSKTQ